MEKDYYLQSIEFDFETRKLSTNDIKALKHQFLNNIPKHLYKYRNSGDKGRIDFYVGERKIYTASFYELGDAFEGITPATKNRILASSGGEEMCRYYKDSIINILKTNFQSLNEQLANTIFDIILDEHFDNESIYKRILPFVKDSERKRLKTTISALDYIFRKFDTELNSNTKFADGMKMLMDINNLMGAFCMCSTYENDTLWEDYADHFHGYCIEYDFTDPCRSKGSLLTIKNLFPVKYVKKKEDDWFKPLFELTINNIHIDGRINPNAGGILFNKWMIEMVCSKKDIWSNQLEWRILGKANTSYLGPLISSIIVGHKINKTDFEKIERYANEKYIPLKITFIDYEKQKVGIRDITEEDIREIKERTTHLLVA